jgi:hypothetical protein
LPLLRLTAAVNLVWVATTDAEACCVRRDLPTDAAAVSGPLAVHALICRGHPCEELVGPEHVVAHRASLAMQGCDATPSQRCGLASEGRRRKGIAYDLYAARSTIAGVDEWSTALAYASDWSVCRFSVVAGHLDLRPIAVEELLRWRVFDEPRS